MKAKFCILAGLWCAVVAFGDRPPATQIVVLDNENLLQGNVSPIDGGYLVRQEVGGETMLPASRVVAVVADKRAAFGVLSSRANLRDADERLRLAKWCMKNELYVEGLAEAEAAVKMRDNFVAAMRVAQTLSDLQQQSTSKPAAKPDTSLVDRKDAVSDVKAIDYNSESYGLYASKINAILTNACANCHAGPEAKAFRLTRVGGRSGLQQNMMSALAQINPSEPERSPILVNAISAHGNAKSAPFRIKTHPAYVSLESWARIARAPEGTTAADPALPKKLPEEVIEGTSPTPKTSEAGVSSFGQDKSAESSKPKGNDPFDPAIFNGATRPKAPGK